MQRLNKEQLAELPAPVSLTPEQLLAVAAGTATQFKPTSFFPVIVAGGIFGPNPTSMPQMSTVF